MNPRVVNAQDRNIQIEHRPRHLLDWCPESKLSGLYVPGSLHSRRLLKFVKYFIKRASNQPGNLVVPLLWQPEASCLNQFEESHLGSDVESDAQEMTDAPTDVHAAAA